MRILARLFLALGLLFSLPVFAEPVIGKAVPDFVATDIQGNTVKLSDLKDKIVVLEWNNPECPFVHKHYGSGNMQALQKKYEAQGVVWITINSGAPGREGYVTNEQAKQYLQKTHSTTEHYIRDVDGSIGHLYGAVATPCMIVIDKGTLAYMGAIDSKPSTDVADIATAENYVAKALDEILAGKPVSVHYKQQYGCSVKYAE